MGEHSLLDVGAVLGPSSNGRDLSGKQQQTLNTLKTLVQRGVNVDAHIEALTDLAESRDTSRHVQLASIEVLATIFSDPRLYEQCSKRNALLASLWRLFLGGEESGALWALHGITSVCPQDFSLLFDCVKIKPEDLPQRALAHSIQALRPAAVLRFGNALVHSWPCVSAGHDETLTGSYIEALRGFLECVCNTNVAAKVRSAALGVLDALLCAYMATEPPCFAAVALFHPLWKFGAPFALPLVELSRDLESMVPCLCDPPEGAAASVEMPCPWILEGGEPSTDVLTEAAAFRATLVWIIACAGGLAGRGRNASDSWGSLIFDLVSETSNSNVSQHGHVIQVPDMVLTVLNRARRIPGSDSLVQFARSRATLMHMFFAIVCRRPNLLEDAQSMAEHLANPNAQLTQFCVEGLSIALSHWPFVTSNLGLGALSEFVALGHRVLLGGIQSLPPVSPCSSCRLVRFLDLLATAVVECHVRLKRLDRSRMDIANHLAEVRSVDLLFVGFICRGLAAVRAGTCGDTQGKLAWLAIATDAVTGGCEAILRDAKTPSASAAAWWLQTLIRSACEEGADKRSLLRPLVDMLNLPPHLSGTPYLALSFASTLCDAGAASAIASGARNSLNASPQVTEKAPMVKEYFETIRGCFRQHSAPGVAQIAAQLCDPGVAVACACWLHMLSDPVDPPEWRVALSGPPVMATAQLDVEWPHQRVSQIVVRIDLYNNMALSVKKLQVGLSISEAFGGSRTWLLPSGVKSGQTIESLPSRGALVVMRDFVVTSLQPLHMTVKLSYDNAADISVADAPDSRPEGADQDAWSEDEDAENDRLHFTCFPCPLPLSVFFRPFRGFDFPPGAVFPPPSIFSACPHVHVESDGECGKLNLSSWAVPEWSPAGFHRISHGGRQRIVPDVEVCFVGVCFDNSMLCLICKGRLDVLEVRSNSEDTLQSFVHHLRFWVMSASLT